jgi:hypothetical protein
MESLDSNIQTENTSFITGEIRDYLTETAKWGKFLAIMGYVGIGLILIMAVVVIGMGSSFSPLFPEGSGMGGMNMGFIGFFYIAFAAFYFFPVYYLHQFSIKIKDGLSIPGSQSIAAGFQNLKSLFKFMGIFTIVILSLYALIIIFAIVGAAL